MTEEEISVKFNALGTDVVGLESCHALRTLIMAIEEQPSLDGLFELMVDKVTA